MVPPLAGVCRCLRSGCRLAALTMMLVCGPTGWAAPADSSRFEQRVRPLLKSYCYDCHGDGAKEGNLALDQFATAQDALQGRDLWWKVLKNLRSGVMPPAGEKRPSQDELETIAQWVKFEVFGIDPKNPD